jgi:hypothetical protein
MTTSSYNSFIKANELLRKASKARDSGNFKLADRLESEAIEISPDFYNANFPTPEHHHIDIED